MWNISNKFNFCLFMESWVLWVSCKVNEWFHLLCKCSLTLQEFTYFARDPKYSWSYEHSKNWIHFLCVLLCSNSSYHAGYVNTYILQEMLAQRISHPLLKHMERICQKAIFCPLAAINDNCRQLTYLLYTLEAYLSRDTWFPTMWHFDKWRLRWACAASS